MTLDSIASLNEKLDAILKSLRYYQRKDVNCVACGKSDSLYAVLPVGSFYADEPLCVVCVMKFIDPLIDMLREVHKLGRPQP